MSAAEVVRERGLALGMVPALDLELDRSKLFSWPRRIQLRR
jgi:hypothetical protein